jgi:hypothetical protein
VLIDRRNIRWVPEARFACDVARRRASCRLAGWGGMGVIYGCYLGLLVLRSRRDGLPFGDAKKQARATGSGEG